MEKVITIHDPGTWQAAAADSVSLVYDDRYRRRLVVESTAGRKLLLDRDTAAPLLDGSALEIADGSLFQVVAAPEDLLEIRAHGVDHLVRLAWHLGNRHLPTELAADRLKVRYDHVIADMARGLGADVNAILEPFHPEGGAYGHGRVHDHEH
ncbi:urease accessory protein UreE [Yunchengibacter salinarum]|uniref:urease accessory protein UreE n=1 Tax=Yunchengibacter salinarum TaxID=3133399 RepID=UPI0035B5C7EA